MNETLRRDFPTFDQAAPTLRSAQVRGEQDSSRRALRPEPTIPVVGFQPTSSPRAAGAAVSSGGTLLAVVAREVVLGLIGVACRAMDTGWT